MQLSAFNVYVPGFPAVGETLVYNTFSGGSVVLDDACLDGLRRGHVDESVAELRDPELGMVVESRQQEEAEFAAWMRRVKEDTGTIGGLVSTSYACNLACTYCCQEEFLGGRTMSVETADKIAAFLEDKADAVRPRRIELCFIGGEPLLHPHLIERISKRMQAAAARIDATYSFQIVTNGTLMTPEVITRLVAVGLACAQVTVDGDECSHGITRVDKKGRNSFHDTWANVLACLPLVPIALQGNYTDANLHGFLPLLERMKRDGMDPQRIPRVKFKPALTALGAPEDAGYESCTWSNARPEVQIALGDAVRAFGYRTHDHLDLGPCAIHQINHFSFGPEGHIYKCPGFLGKAEWATGDLHQGGLTAKHAQLNKLANTRECGPCAYRPACAGGCIATEWLRSGSPEGLNCERTYFDTVGVGVIQRNYYLETMEPHEAEQAIARMGGHQALPTAATSEPTRQEPQRLVQIRTRPPQAVRLAG